MDKRIQTQLEIARDEIAVLLSGMPSSDDTTVGRLNRVANNALDAVQIVREMGLAADNVPLTEAKEAKEEVKETVVAPVVDADPAAEDPGEAWDGIEPSEEEPAEIQAEIHAAEEQAEIPATATNTTNATATTSKKGKGRK